MPLLGAVENPGLQHTLLRMLHDMIKVSFRYNQGPRSVDSELIKRKVSWVSLADRPFISRECLWLVLEDKGSQISFESPIKRRNVWSRVIVQRVLAFHRADPGSILSVLYVPTRPPRVI